MKRFNKLFTQAVICGSMALFAASSYAADNYPNKPVTIVVPTAVGGGSDVIARIFADYLHRRLGQPVIVENRPGASGAIGTSQVSRAPADGYTLLFNGSEFGALPAVRDDLNYDFREFTYLARAFTIQPLLLGGAKLPASTVPELVEHMKKNPGKVTYGSTGVGGVIHLAMALFEHGADVEGLHVPFVGQSPNLAALQGGYVDISQGVIPLPSGLNVLASVGSRRNAAFPELPTLGELGFKDATWDIWYGFLAPPNVPADISEKLSKEIAAILKDPEAIKKFSDALGGAQPDVLIGEDFKAAVFNEYSKWKELAEKYDISIE